MTSDISVKMESETPAASPPSSSSAADAVWLRQGPLDPHLRLPRSVRGTERQRPQSEYTPDPLHPYYRSHVAPVTPAPSSKTRRIPRPPNAFILYRSDLIAQGSIPNSRQQTLSRVAGECWNLLPPEEKKVWQDRAAQRAAAHQLEYPDYHFKPSPRGKGKSKLRSNDDNSGDAIRALREKYTGVLGPSICSSRHKKNKFQGKEEQPDAELASPYPSTSASFEPSDIQGLANFDWAAVQHQPDAESWHRPSPVVTPSFSPFDMQGLNQYNWSFPPADSPTPSLPSPGSASSDAPLPPFFPQSTFPHITPPRRPSTSLGFIRRLNVESGCAAAGRDLERPASAASDTGLTNLVRDLSITPTVASFGHISMPDMYASTDTPANNILSPFPFSAVNAQFNGFPMASTSSFAETQFPMTLDDTYPFANNNDANLFDNWSFEDVDQSENGN